MIEKLKRTIFHIAEENIKGSLERGKLADFVVLTDSILEKSPDEIRKIKVSQTYLGGKRVFS